MRKISWFMVPIQVWRRSRQRHRQPLQSLSVRLSVTDSSIVLLVFDFSVWNTSFVLALKGEWSYAYLFDCLKPRIVLFLEILLRMYLSNSTVRVQGFRLHRFLFLP